jgi:hypothetical protein
MGSTLYSLKMKAVFVTAGKKQKGSPSKHCPNERIDTQEQLQPPSRLHSSRVIQSETP